MKKTISYILSAVILVLQLCGCGADEREPADSPNTEKTQDTQDPGGSNGSGGAASPESTLDASAVLNLNLLDNSLDAYSRIIDTPLKAETPENALQGGAGASFLGESRAYYFKKHLLSSWKENWDEIFSVSAQGETDSVSFDFAHQLWAVGPAAGTDHYLTFSSGTQEGTEESCYILTERDENHEAVREIPLNFLNGSSLSEALDSLLCFAADSSGTVHLVLQTPEGQQYLLLSSEGDILTEYHSEEDSIRELVPLNDGRIAFLYVETLNDEARTSLQYLDGETDEPTLLAAPKTVIYRMTLLDGDTLLYANGEGVYRCDLSGNNPEPLYLWRNHGIISHGVSALQADEEGRISLIYESSENDNYLCLEPTTEEVEICQITMAVSPNSASEYEPIVALFNRRYPGCHIELKEYEYNDTALLTQLIAGQGPVLIGTYAIPFTEHAELWEPLDTFMEQLGITQELLPSVLEPGRINGTLYGVVRDFSLDTMVTGNPNLKDWDYETFIQCIEDSPELEAVFNQYDGDFGSFFVMGFVNGIDDIYFLDAEAGTTNFDSDEFRRILELAKKYCVRKEEVLPGSSVTEGKVLCNKVSIYRPEQLALYRSCYGEDANYIGYPTKNGAAHFIEARNAPLAIRRTATEREKAAAGAFLSLCLSYEGQTLAAKGLNFGLSVRRDVLEEQIAAMNRSTMVYVYGFDPFRLGSALNVDLDRKTLLDLIDRAEPVRSCPPELSDIMYEELDAYFSGTITEDMLIDRLENRVGLWLGERN